MCTSSLYPPHYLHYLLHTYYLPSLPTNLPTSEAHTEIIGRTHQTDARPSMQVRRQRRQSVTTPRLVARN